MLAFSPVLPILSPPLPLLEHLRHRKKSVNKTAMSDRIRPFCNDEILMRFVCSSFFLTKSCVDKVTCICNVTCEAKTNEEKHDKPQESPQVKC